MSVFGWCNDGFHEGGKYKYGTACPGIIAVYKDDKQDHPVVVREKTCECPCHET